MKRTLFRFRKTLQENHGAESIEWIAIIAILMILLFALSSMISQRSPGYADDISETITYYTELWGGKDARNTGTSAGGSLTSGQASTGDERGFWYHLEGAAYGFFVDGLYETGKGLLILGKDLVVMAPLTGDLIDLAFPGLQDETREKYAQVIDAIANDPAAAAQAMVQPMIDAWEDEDYGRLIGTGLFEVASIWLPGDEVGKLAKFEKVVPDEVGMVIARTNKIDDVVASGKLRYIATDTWESLGGLKYGPDPTYGNRVKHVLRHADDQPTRSGKHGVFSAGRTGTIKTIDEAWSLVKNGSDRVKVTPQGNRTVYEIDMGRPIGYVGGQEGAHLGNPQVEHIRIVVEGDNNIITAFPTQPTP